MAERLEGAPRRVRREWSQAFKTRQVAATLVPDANVSALARGEGISPSQLFGCRRHAMRNGTVTALDNLENPRLGLVEASVSSTIEIIIDGVVLRAGAQIGEEHLRRVIRAVRSA